LCPGLSVTFTREATGEKKEWHYEDGLKDYLLEQLENKSFLPQEPLMGHFENNETADWAMVWSLEENASVTESYVNLIPTVQGGTHVAGLKQGLIDAMREFCDLHNLLPRGVKLSSDDSWDQCNFILSVKLTDPQFSGQTKEKLSSMECQTFVSGIVKDAFSLWLNTHIEEAKSLAELVIDNAQKRLRKAKTVTRKKVTTGPALPGKLTDCISQESDQCELFIVEGDSAGGSAKQARDKNYQAILPIRGKILNTWEVSSDQVLASQEVHDIAVALGVDPDSDNLSGLRYGKICILADADSDGAHIATLLCALFFKHFPVLVRQGHVHVAMPPLYRIDVGKEMFYALDDAEKQGILDQITAEKKRGTAHIQRFKGLGEMNPSQLRETTMNPETRRLVQLTLQEESKATDMMDLLLAKQRANDRKKWLEEKGDLAEVS
ncbi:MAG: DNA topoisomerase IV subunit B, partial [Gammaproteobacteria bacterium RIFOXYB2_FULL_38_6]